MLLTLLSIPTALTPMHLWFVVQASVCVPLAACELQEGRILCLGKPVMPAKKHLVFLKCHDPLFFWGVRVEL